MVAFIRILVVAVLLSGTTPVRLRGQEPPAAEANASFFSGTVADFSSSRVTVSRNHLGKNESRTFVITQETKVEGRIRNNARVTVRFRSAEEGDVAVHIIVRGNGAQSARRLD
jgi:hypothetical protein